MNKKNQSLVIFLAYIAFIYALYSRLGIIDINEAEKYISAAAQIAEGNILTTLKNYTFYSSYVLFLSILLPLGGIKFVVIIQVILNITASHFLKKTLNELTDSNKYGTIAQAIFLFCYPIQVWTISLFSDNFFICIISICLYFTLKKKKEKKDLIILAFLLTVLLLARPPGIMFVYCYLLYYIYQRVEFSPPILLIFSIIGFCLIHILIFSAKVETKTYIKPIVAGSIIIDKPDYDIAEFNYLEKASLIDAYQYLFKNNTLAYVLTLYIKKIISFFTLTRPYYSNVHNFILYFYYLLYPLSLAGIFRMFRSQKTAEGLLIIVAILLCANLTGLTYNEWHYRFTIEVFPLLIISSGYYLVHLIKIKWYKQIQIKK